MCDAAAVSCSACSYLQLPEHTMNTVSSNSNSVPHSFTSLQITKYVEREIMNHRSLMHPHIVQFKEVSLSQVIAIDLSGCLPVPFVLHPGVQRSLGKYAGGSCRSLSRPSILPLPWSMLLAATCLSMLSGRAVSKRVKHDGSSSSCLLVSTMCIEWSVYPEHMQPLRA